LEIQLTGVLTEDLRKIGERAAEKNVTLRRTQPSSLAPRTPNTTTPGARGFVRELGGAAWAVRELTTLSSREK
jgi:hypothetical protein